MKTINVKVITNKVRNLHKKALEVVTDIELENYFYTIEAFNKATQYESTIGDNHEIGFYRIPQTFGKLLVPSEVKIMATPDEIDLLIRENLFEYNIEQPEILSPAEFNEISDVIQTHLGRKLKSGNLIEVEKKAAKLEVARENHVADTGSLSELKGMPIQLAFTGRSPRYYYADFESAFDLWLTTEVFNSVN